MSWLSAWLDLAASSGRRLSVSKTWTFSGPDAGGDKCRICNVARRDHDGKDHPFNEGKGEKS